MDSEPVDTLLETIEESVGGDGDTAADTSDASAVVSFDGLTIRRGADGFAFTAGDETVSGLSAAGLRDRATEHEPYVRNWWFWTQDAPTGRDRRAFLRWIEGGSERALPERLEDLADGIEASWGQLHITVTLGDSTERRYELRHVDDADRPSEALTAYDDPLGARELTKYADDGAYRPLSTAPTLQTGWVFPYLDATGLVRAVENFYPATIANWFREREGDLDVDHWRATAERQTGIYDLLEDLPREAVDWIAEACCVDSQCLKRREWQYDDGDEIDVDGGDGTFPCREPCSLVIAAARKWTILEGETERTYEFTLTPSEKRQLEELIDAVAEGRTDEIREADVGDGANRYRARYLRAKRFDDDGNLCGVSGTDDTESDEQGH